MKGYILNGQYATISIENLKSILGDALYHQFAIDTLKYGYRTGEKGERPVFVYSIPMECLSREKRMAIYSLAEKRPVHVERMAKKVHNRQRHSRLSSEVKALLQELVDERCRVITERYLEDRNTLSMEYMKDMQKPEFRAALSQYPVPYTDPRTVLYFESFDSLYQNHHDEMQRLLNICKTLALKTNPHLDRVLGCNVQSHKCEPRV